MKVDPRGSYHSKDFSSYIWKKAAWLEVNIGGSFFRIAATALFLLNSVSRKRRTAFLSQPRGCTKSVYSDRSQS